MDRLNDLWIDDGLRRVYSGTVQIVAPDGTVIASPRGYWLPTPGWYPSEACVAGMISEDS